MLRDRIYEIIEAGNTDTKASRAYDVLMMVTILLSIIPLAFKSTNSFFMFSEIFASAIFICDYVLRWITADKKIKKGVASFFVYPFCPMAIADLLSILPTFTVLSDGFRLLRILRLLRTFRIFRVYKVMRYSKSVDIITNVIRKQKTPLLAVCTLAIGYILVSALIVFNIEPETFENFFDAIYWATISLTTVGYGDIYPVTIFGRIVTMISSLIGIAVVAMPAGIITAGYMEEIKKSEVEK